MARFPAFTHLESQSRFELAVEGGTAVCDYRRHGDVLDLVHTGVPPALQGQGVAAELVRLSLDWVRSQGLKVRPVCSYVVTYVQRHPEVHDLLAG